MTCKQLGGVCEAKLSAKTFEEIGQMAQNHGMEMAGKGDKDHIAVMERMRENMMDNDAMQKWMEEKKKEFESLPEDN